MANKLPSYAKRAHVSSFLFDLESKPKSLLGPPKHHLTCPPHPAPPHRCPLLSTAHLSYSPLPGSLPLSAQTTWGLCTGCSLTPKCYSPQISTFSFPDFLPEALKYHLLPEASPGHPFSALFILLRACHTLISVRMPLLILLFIASFPLSPPLAAPRGQGFLWVYPGMYPCTHNRAVGTR